MRYICCLLAILVLTLSVQPVCASVLPIQAAGVADSCCRHDDCDQPEEHHDKGCKSCNPFQLCGCCAFSVVVPQPVAFAESTVTATAVVQGLQPGTALCDAPLASCWQPPNMAL